MTLYVFFISSNPLPIILDILFKNGVIVLLQHLTVTIIIAAISKIVQLASNAKLFKLSICLQLDTSPAYI